jgi:hypothetical protein
MSSASVESGAAAVGDQLHAPQQAAAAHVADHLAALVQVAQTRLDPLAQLERALGQPLAAQRLEHGQAGRRGNERLDSARALRAG